MTITKETLRVFWVRLKTRLVPLMDMSAWVLLILSAVPLALTDPAMLVTLAGWTVYGLALAGIAVVINRLIYPQVHLTDFVDKALEGNVAAAIVVVGVMGSLTFFFLGLVLWAKA